MFYSEAERKIYVSPSGDRYDPLAVQRKLRIASRGQVNEALLQWHGDDDLEAAVAEENLVGFARVAFQFASFEDDGPTDAEVLDTLVHFLAAIKNSASVDATPPTAPSTTECRS